MAAKDGPADSVETTRIPFTIKEMQKFKNYLFRFYINFVQNENILDKKKSDLSQHKKKKIKILRIFLLSDRILYFLICPRRENGYLFRFRDGNDYSILFSLFRRKLIKKCIL